VFQKLIINNNTELTLVTTCSSLSSQWISPNLNNSSLNSNICIYWWSCTDITNYRKNIICNSKICDWSFGTNSYTIDIAGVKFD